MACDQFWAIFFHIINSLLLNRKIKHYIYKIKIKNCFKKVRDKLKRGHVFRKLRLRRMLAWLSSWLWATLAQIWNYGFETDILNIDALSLSKTCPKFYLHKWRMGTCFFPKINGAKFHFPLFCLGYYAQTLFQKNVGRKFRNEYRSAKWILRLLRLNLFIRWQVFQHNLNGVSSFLLKFGLYFQKFLAKQLPPIGTIEIMV